MTYSQTLDWMFAQLPIYQNKGKSAFNGKLDNIKLFSKALGSPEKQFKSIHVAGTNGKGSSSHMLASILQEAGYRVGLYTSPHLKDFRERIRINGDKIPQSHVINFVEDNMSFFKAHKLSFFEMTVAMAFAYFANENVDIAIIEVGLGGRLDSTNIITPEVSLITNIGLDHTDLLGDTLEKIAVEKGGIIKNNIPVVVSENQTETAPIFEEIANLKNAPIFFADSILVKTYKTSLLGNYQQKNIKGVLATLKQLKEFIITNSAIEKGLLNVVENTGLMGRWQLLQEQPRVICDTAHNKEGLSLTIKQLEAQKYESLFIVLGVVKDKNLDAILPLFPKNANYFFCCPKIERGLNAEELKGEASGFLLQGNAYSSVKEALEKAKSLAKKEDLIYVGGSTFVVAEIV
ncbi:MULTISPECIES: bifunctional folylpolyglutamate synthase/dihydrofolate synthase [unclassified Cellulophaga]|uniref:bifunctional folylpolyglutamate synthase/dihydrofolate synthase n=1 Tax=unclassified Cellulophaga TaxID=2634405 RepID=UPI0026E3B90F|nr:MULTISPECIES: folylpolyglutamate synthase/dihydrofolate synthase family protein [unclassified Cellulophaga]MDO6490452.1 folylpolyglutamate synthase/dihydrofolate synthase family protein [Cellulophaga sp. 2_MG-2023]MDO6494354.1 folylpolyglutamate synthase/dihydrofolate synthase family protein [Cellulophaga sp. 3_MG-2023]